MLPNLSGLSCLPCTPIGVVLSEEASAAQQAMSAAQQAMLAAEANWMTALGLQECSVCLGRLSEPAPQRDGAQFPLPQGGVPLVLQTCANNHWTHGACQLFAYQKKLPKSGASAAANEANRRTCVDCRAPLLSTALAALGIDPPRQSASSVAIDPESAAGLRQRANAALERERNERREATRVARDAERERQREAGARVAEWRRSAVNRRSSIAANRANLQGFGSPWHFTGMSALADYLDGLTDDWRRRLVAIHNDTPEIKTKSWSIVAFITVERAESLARMARKAPDNIAGFPHNKFVKAASMLWYGVRFASNSVEMALLQGLYPMTTAMLNFSRLVADEINTNLTARLSEVYPALTYDVLGWDPQMKRLFEAERDYANWDYVQEKITASIAKLRGMAAQVAEYEANYATSDPPEPAT